MPGHCWIGLALVCRCTRLVNSGDHNYGCPNNECKLPQHCLPCSVHTQATLQCVCVCVCVLHRQPKNHPIRTTSPDSCATMTLFWCSMSERPASNSASAKGFSPS